MYKIVEQVSSHKSWSFIWNSIGYRCTVQEAFDMTMNKEEFPFKFIVEKPWKFLHGTAVEEEAIPLLKEWVFKSYFLTYRMQFLGINDRILSLHVSDITGMRNFALFFRDSETHCIITSFVANSNAHTSTCGSCFNLSLEKNNIGEYYVKAVTDKVKPLLSIAQEPVPFQLTWTSPAIASGKKLGGAIRTLLWNYSQVDVGPTKHCHRGEYVYAQPYTEEEQKCLVPFLSDKTPPKNWLEISGNRYPNILEIFLQVCPLLKPKHKPLAVCFTLDPLDNPDPAYWTHQYGRMPMREFFYIAAKSKHVIEVFQASMGLNSRCLQYGRCVGPTIEQENGVGYGSLLEKAFNAVTAKEGGRSFILHKYEDYDQDWVEARLKEKIMSKSM